MITNDEREDIRYGYQAAVAMATYEGTLSWTAIASFTPLLLAFIAGSVVDRLPFVQAPLLILLVNIASSALGCAASFLWYSATLRSRYYHKYWIASARELESKLSGVETLQKGRHLNESHAITVGTETIRFPCLARHSHTRTLSLLYVFTLVIFGCLLFFHICRFAWLIPI